MLTFIYYVLCFGVAIQRVFELRKSQQHSQILRVKYQAQEYGHMQLIFMKGLHTFWLIACLLEPWFFNRSWNQPFFAFGFLLLFFVGQSLRLAAIQALGVQWNIRILVAKQLPRVRNGVYRYISHPNYAGVAIELIALPMILKCYYTAALATLANALLMIFRINRENQALAQKSIV